MRSFAWRLLHPHRKASTMANVVEFAKNAQLFVIYQQRLPLDNPDKPIMARLFSFFHLKWPFVSLPVGRLLRSGCGILLCGLLVGAISCTPEVEADFTVDGACPAPQPVKEHLAQNPGAETLACLVLFWQSQPETLRYHRAIKTLADGTIQPITLDPSLGSQGLKLPVSALKHPFLTRIYLLPPNKTKELQETPAAHDVLCQKMSQYNYDCFEQPNECWVAMMMEPTLKAGGTTFQSYPLNLPNDQKCVACVPEVCDKVDNDCDGQVDEIDANTGLKCSGDAP